MIDGDHAVPGEPMSDAIYIGRAGNRLGPFTLAQASEMVAKGEIRANDYAWHEGMPGWAGAFSTLKALGVAVPDQPEPPPLPPAYSSSNPTGVVNAAAGHWARIGAAILDSMICSGFLFVAMIVLGVVMGTQGTKGKPPDLGSIGLVYLVLISAQVAYFTITQGGSKMASLGKRATDLVIVTRSGEPIGYVRAFARYVVLIVTGLFFSLPLLVILFTRRHQGLHDLTCGTVVIDKRTFDRSRWDYETVAASPNSSGAAIIVIALLFFFMTFIGIAAAIAIPAYQDFLVRAKVSEALLKTNDVKARYVAYVKEHQAWPASIDDLKAPSVVKLAQNGEVSFQIADGHALMLTLHGDRMLDGKSLELLPIGGEASFEWKCRVVDLPPKYAPSACR